MKRNRLSDEAADRGISEMVGTVLLIGLVIFASFVVVVLGASPIADANEQTTKQSAETVLQEIDSRLATLASSADASSVELDLDDSLPADLDSEEFGYLNLTVNNNGTCSVQEDLHQIRYVGQKGETIGYEAGGTFRGGRNNSISITAPDVTYREGAVDISLLNISGNVDQRVNTARLNESASENRTQHIEETVLQGACMRPDNVTLTVQSQYYQAWGDYLEEEFAHLNSTIETFDGNLTARVFLNQSALPRSVDDDRNLVVNLSEDPTAAYMDYVWLNNSGPDPPPVGSPEWDAEFTKNAGNNYTVFVEPLTEGDLEIGEIREIGNVTNATRPPLDVMLVLDESGSMNNNSGLPTKMSVAKGAAKRFVGDLNESKDRSGVISYDTSAQYRRAGGQYYISGEKTAVNASIDTISDHPSGGTRADRGLKLANSVHDLYSNESRDKVTILLTDGKNDGCKSGEANDDDPYDCHSNREALDFVNNSAAAGGTVYSIGLGNSLDEAFLQEVANLSGGSYYQVDNADQLDEVFDDIRQEIANQKFIARTPMSSNMTNYANGQLYTPQIAGDTDGIGNISTGGHTFMNVNDPQAPSKFSHAFAIQDADPLYFNVTQYDCETWGSTGRVRTNNGTAYKVARCVNMTKNATGFKPRLDDDGDGLFDEDPPGNGNEDGDGRIHEDPRNGILTDGDNASALLEQTPGWWQSDINVSLAAFPDVTINKTTGGGDYGKLSMKSNQALVVFDLPDGPDSTNMLVLLYQVGLAEEDARPDGVINVQVSHVTID